MKAFQKIVVLFYKGSFCVVLSGVLSFWRGWYWLVGWLGFLKLLKQNASVLINSSGKISGTTLHFMS